MRSSRCGCGDQHERALTSTRECEECGLSCFSLLPTWTIADERSPATTIMGLLTIIRKAAHKEHQLRLLFLGLDNSGKSTILKRLLNDSNWDSISPTLGFDIKSLQFSNYTLNIWDIGGQKVLRPFWKNYFERTDGLIWVIDSADQIRMQECKEELWNLIVKEDRLSTCSLLVLANKQDLDNAMSLQEISRELDLENLIRQRGGNAKILACSAVAATGYEVGLQWVVEDCADRLYYGDAVQKGKEGQKGKDGQDPQSNATDANIH
ncbi:unnamed protein product [Sympodiomycopsis kandeliae]